MKHSELFKSNVLKLVNCFQFQKSIYYLKISVQMFLINLGVLFILITLTNLRWLMIRVKPNVGEFMIISKNWFTSNQFFTQYMTNMTPAKVYEILRVEDSIVPDEWGIASIRDHETKEVFDIDAYPELADYFCIFNAFDDFRLVSIG